eukprot:9493425-Pyramimonas_sp.AAC.1
MRGGGPRVAGPRGAQVSAPQEPGDLAQRKLLLGRGYAEKERDIGLLKFLGAGARTGAQILGIWRSSCARRGRNDRGARETQGGHARWGNETTARTQRQRARRHDSNNEARQMRQN